MEFRDKGRNLFYKAFHPELTGDIRTDGMRVESKGAVTFPIATPGDMTRIRCNAFWRARDKRDGYDVEVSYDGGQTFRPVLRLGGPDGRRNKILHDQRRTRQARGSPDCGSAAARSTRPCSSACGSTPTTASPTAASAR